MPNVKLSELRGEQMKIMSKFNKKRLAVALLATASFMILTHIPSKYVPDGLDKFDLDKTLHILAYGVLTALAIMAIKPPRTWSLRLGLVVVLLVLAITDETTQVFVGRCGSNADLMADIVGMLVALALSASWTWKDLVGNSQL